MSLTVKICGLTRASDVAAAVQAGADALGFVFAASPRRITAAQAAALTAPLPGRIIRVGLFMNQSLEELEDVLDAVDLDLIQFHGDEDNAFCTGFGLPFLKAVSMYSEDPEAEARSFPDAAGILVDSHAPGGAGGTGRSFVWDRRPATDAPLWLAGGLTPDNVAAAVRRFRPDAVDVSSGVESAPGIKDHALIRDFINNARQV